MDNNSVAAGDPFAYAGHKKYQGLEHIDGVVRRSHPELLAEMDKEQVKLGRQDLRRIMAMGVEEPDADED